MSKKNDSFNLSYSWTQQYSLNPQYTNFSFTVNDWVYYNESMLESIENKLAEMDRYPEAEAIIKKAQNGL